MDKRISVLIADDHPPTRAGIRTALEDAGIGVSAEVGDASAAVEAARRERPDVCLLDIHMPGNGINAAKTISLELPGTPIVMLTVSINEDDLFDALRAGASGYLIKDINPERLGPALRSVLEGEAALPRNLVARLIDEFAARDRRRRTLTLGNRGTRLTSREWEVIELLKPGLTTKEIADRLSMSPATVRSHVRAILKKLNVSDRESVIRLMHGNDPEPWIDT